MRGLYLTLFVLACFVLLAPQTADAQPNKAGSKRCGQCHNAQPDAAQAVSTAIDGTAGTTVSVPQGGSFEIDFYYPLQRGGTPTRGVAGYLGLPSGWTVGTTTVNTNPGTLGGQAWQAVWDNPNVGNGCTTPGWTANIAETADTYVFSAPMTYVQQFQDSTWETASGAARDDGTAGDLDGLTDKMGGDVRITVPGGAAPGGYTIYVGGVGHNAAGTKAMAYATITVTVTDASDSTPPNVTSTVPTNGATGVTADGTVTINFDENIDCTTVNTTNVTSDSPGWALNTCAGTQAIFDTSGQAGSTTYNFSVTSAVTDLAGNPLNAAPYNFSYTTAAADVTPPNVSSTVPTNGASDIALNSNVTINFDENIDCSTVNTTNVTSDSPIWNLSTCSGSTAVFTTGSQANSTSYNVSVTGAVQDLAGNPLNAAPYNFSYTTIAASNNPPADPSQVSLDQADGGGSVAQGAFTGDASATMSGTVTDPDGDTVQLHVEIRPIASAFTGTPNCTSAAPAASGSTCTATCGPMAEGLYKWQARGHDAVNGTNSGWVQF